MDVLKQFLFRLIEIFIFLAIGLFFTVMILKPIYESFGIPFSGNVWVNWFSVSYILFVFYTLILGLSLMKGSSLFKQRLTSKFFWLLFIGSNFIVFIPFLKGENPF